jgi:hypothetical protein
MKKPSGKGNKSPRLPIQLGLLATARKNCDPWARLQVSSSLTFRTLCPNIISDVSPYVFV